MFATSDRANYPIKIRVHAKCNHSWHTDDEKMAIFFDVLHGNKNASNPVLQKKLTFIDIGKRARNVSGNYKLSETTLDIPNYQGVHTRFYTIITFQRLQ